MSSCYSKVQKKIAFMFKGERKWNYKISQNPASLQNKYKYNLRKPVYFSFLLPLAKSTQFLYYNKIFIEAWYRILTFR